MHQQRKRRLISLLLLLSSAAIATALTLFALRDNINLFYTPTQVVAGDVLTDQRFRLGGLVVEDSIERAVEGLGVRFAVTDQRHVVYVSYEGILPDLFRAGQGVVATGHLQADGVFQAEQILAKHDENYMPPEVQAALA